MFCKKCGKLISDDASFCPHCGTTCSRPISQAPSNYYQDSYSGQGSSGVNVVSIVGFVLSIICLFIVEVWEFFI